MWVFCTSEFNETLDKYSDDPAVHATITDFLHSRAASKLRWDNPNDKPSPEEIPKPKMTFPVIQTGIDQLIINQQQENNNHG